MDNNGGTTGPDPQPDIMNDPGYATNGKGKQNNLDEADTCRICRGEGSQEEPLFYPCKCSGSIKFVHQNCLMEWLSHSQKKHCELCKTPFRFTKLYHPHMPSTVPFPVFFRQAAVHTSKSLLTWLRLHLVMFVWVAWLPWCMRGVWKGLFWLGEGGWIGWKDHKVHAEPPDSTRPAVDSVNGTTLGSQGFFGSREAAASAFASYISDRLPRIISSIHQAIDPRKFGSKIVGTIKKVCHDLISHKSSENLAPSFTANKTSFAEPVARPSTWLSDFRALRTLTRWTRVNNLVIDALEGQLITLGVVLVFILVFLIREWVMQQQQNLRIGPDGAADGGARRNAELRPRQDAQPAGQGAPADQGDDVAQEAERGIPRVRNIARARPRRPIRHGSAQNINHNIEAPAPGSGLEEREPLRSDVPTNLISQGDDEEGRNHSEASPTSIQRPAMPGRDIIARAAEIGRSIEEHDQVSQDQINLEAKVFEDLWIHAQQRPSEVLRIIENDGRSDELAWIVKCMERLGDLPSPSGHALSDASTTNEESDKQKVENGLEHSDEDSDIPKLPTRSSSQGIGIDVEDTGHNRIPPSPSEERSTPNGVEVRSRSQLPPQIVQLKSQDHQINGIVDDQVVTIASLPDSDRPSHSANVTNEHITLQTAEETYGGNDIPQRHDDTSHENPIDPDWEDEPDPSIIKATSNVNNEEGVVPNTAEESTAHQQLRGPGNGPTQGEAVDATPEPVAHATSVTETVMNWLWGGVAIPDPAEQQAGDEEHVVNDIADEEPFVPIAHGHHLMPDVNDGVNPGQDPEVVAAAIQAGIDPNEAEAFDDIEDLEGIMELVGMQGPLAGLAQNGMFCVVLVALIIFFGVWIPYISGKVFLVLVANPFSLLVKLPLRWASLGADLIIDLCIFGLGCAFYWVDMGISKICAPVRWLLPPLKSFSNNKIVAQTARAYAERAFERSAKAFIAVGGSLSESDVPAFSVIAHQSLQSIEAQLAMVLRTVYHHCSDSLSVLQQTPSAMAGIKMFGIAATTNAKALVGFVTEKSLTILSKTSVLFQFNPLRVNLSTPQRTISLDYDLAYWDTKDRALAIIFGYLFFALLGVLYLQISAGIRGNNDKGKVDGSLAEVLYQAGGVMKVVLIISIEMLVFPLYCGLLLDVALLPLFGNITLASRVGFTITSPWTSIFVHWFVGTCYMFHFALFVSMCRKIMRSGVLYFIRDPDDPTFHPVRDVLERSVSTQLWKISFSALVYGGLVIVCLGGVVWGIAYSFDGVFPIHWSSDEPVLEFPVDLLFYNFLMPLAVKFFRPSAVLSRIYDWWFRKCARSLRLTNFLFGEKKEDEEGRHVQRTWIDFLHGRKGNVQNPVIGDRQKLAEDRDMEVYFLRNGRFVRAPASDQVRIPKGVLTFIEVDEGNIRIDGKPESDNTNELHNRNNEMFTKVYIPPLFRIRITAFVFFIWLFAATTGVSITVIPLLFGRYIFAKLTPTHLRMNDIYAFSIGMYILGGVTYLLINHHRLTTCIRKILTPHTTSLESILLKISTITVRLLTLLYTFTVFAILLPVLFSLLIELYLILPLHTYFTTQLDPTDPSQSTITATEPDRHVIHVIQSWTLGVLYIKMFARLILYTAPSRPATALRAIVRRGWLHPDVRLATRAVIFPATMAMLLALIIPLAFGWVATHTILTKQCEGNEIFRASVYRYAYPGLLALGCGIGFLMLLGKAFRSWRRRVRDEVYLIGERLHNFGESGRRKAVSKVKQGKKAVGRA